MAREKNPGGINTGNPLENTCIPAKPIALEHLYLTKHMSISEIGEYLNVSYGAIRGALKKIGVPIRSCQESVALVIKTGRYGIQKRRENARKAAMSHSAAKTEAGKLNIQKAKAVQIQKHKDARIRRVCPVDGTIFFLRPSRAKENYCSKECADKDRCAFTAIGENHGNTKLTEWDVYEIRQLYANGGTSYQKLADQFGVSVSSIRQIVKRRRWASLTIPSLSRDAISPSVVRRNAELAAYLGIRPQQLNSQV